MVEHDIQCVNDRDSDTPNVLKQRSLNKNTTSNYQRTNRQIGAIIVIRR